MVLYNFERGNSMLEINPKKNIDIVYFNEKLVEFETLIDEFLEVLNDGSALDKKLKSLDYQIALDLLNFFELCEKNYALNILSNAIMIYCHQREDEAFLDLYMANQDDTLDEFIKNADEVTLHKILRCFENDKNLLEMFEEVNSKIVNKISFRI